MAVDFFHRLIVRNNADEHSSRPSRGLWWNQPRLRDLATEPQFFAYEIAEKLKSKTPRRRSKARR